MNALQAARHKRHLCRLHNLALELDENVRLTLAELAKDPDTARVRGTLALARCGTSVAVDQLENAIGDLPDGKLKVVA